MENPPNWSLYVHNFFSVNKLILELKHPGRPISIWHLESPLDCKEIQPVHSEGDQPWDFFGRNNAKAETLVLWPPHEKSWLIGKNSDAGRDWGQDEKGTTEDEMAAWHHQHDGCEFKWIPGDGDGQGSLAYSNSWGHKESDMTERLNWTELNWWNVIKIFSFLFFSQSLFYY